LTSAASGNGLGQGSLEATSRYQTILDEKDTTLAESLEDISAPLGTG
jgi:hypothetical protein